MGEEQKVVCESLVPAEDNVDVAATGDGKPVEVTRSEQILKAKDLYSHGSRNFLVKNYADAAEELSEVCRIYDNLYGNLSDELGMPYLLYAKALIALALDENKVIDVPDEEEDEDEEDENEGEDEEENDAAEGEANGEAATSTSEAQTNGEKKTLPTIGEESESSQAKPDKADSTENTIKKHPVESEEKTSSNRKENETVTSTDSEIEKPVAQNGTDDSQNVDDDQPSTSKGKTENTDADDVVEDEDAASSLQLAWEVLELADKIFSRQGMSGLPNLAEVKTELANIAFENNTLDTARSDYEKALKIYDELPNNYRRAKAEIHYKIGLTYLMQQHNKEGADSLKRACELIEEETDELKTKDVQTEKEKNTIQDLEETKQEIWVKIAEIEETEAQTIAEVRAALDSYIKPNVSTSEDVVSSASTVTNSSSDKPTDISHLIKRKKIEDSPHKEAEEASGSAAKRAALSEN